jgi:hypothetical protein
MSVCIEPRGEDYIVMNFANRRVPSHHKPIASENLHLLELEKEKASDAEIHPVCWR